MNRDLKIHFLSGCKEYCSHEALTILAAALETQGARCTFALGEDHGKRMAGLEALAEADVMVVFARRMELEADQLALVQDWCRAGRPVVGIRTASHAFQNWLAFDREILGGSYSNHGPDEPDVRVDVEAPGHPILGDRVGWRRPGRVYRNPEIAPDATVLLSENSPLEGRQPSAWCRVHPQTGGRVFYTSLGCIHDFADSNFTALLAGACRWAAGRLPAAAAPEPRHWVAQLDAIDPARCPCGFSRRAFVRPDNPLATLHMVDIAADSRAHYHKRLTEIYLVLEGEGFMELDGARVPVKPLSTIYIKPGCRHRAVGRMRIVNVPIPAFDPADEWFD